MRRILAQKLNSRIIKRYALKEVVHYECSLLKIDVDKMACWWKNPEMAVGSLEQMELIKVFVEKYKGNVNFIRVEFVESFSKL